MEYEGWENSTRLWFPEVPRLSPQTHHKWNLFRILKLTVKYIWRSKISYSGASNGWVVKQFCELMLRDRQPGDWYFKKKKGSSSIYYIQDWIVIVGDSTVHTHQFRVECKSGWFLQNSGGYLGEILLNTFQTEKDLELECYLLTPIKCHYYLSLLSSFSHIHLNNICFKECCVTKWDNSVTYTLPRSDVVKLKSCKITA